MQVRAIVSRLLPNGSSRSSSLKKTQGGAGGSSSRTSSIGAKNGGSLKSSGKILERPGTSDSGKRRGS
jgi:hypothetical protein